MWRDQLNTKSRTRLETVLLLDACNANDVDPSLKITFTVTQNQFRRFVETCNIIDELMPLKDTLILSWWDNARRSGIITYSEETDLRRFCIDQLYY